MFKRFAPHALALSLAVGLALPVCAAGEAAKAAQFYEDGLARFNREDLPGAIIQLKNALQQDKQMLAAHLLLAKALYRSGQYPAAEVAFQDAQRLGVAISEIAEPLGHLLLALGRPAELLQRLPAAGLPPAVALEVLILRASAQSELRQIDASLATLAQARRLDPAAPGPLRTEAAVLLAVGRLEEARAAALRATGLAPGDAESWNVLASVSHVAGGLADALAGYARALELEPALHDARIARAGILLDLARDGEAGADLEQLRARGNEDPRAAYLRSVIAQRKGDLKAAADELLAVQGLLDRLPREWVAGRQQFLMLGALANHGLGNREAAAEYLDLLHKRFPGNLGARKLLASIQIEAGDSARALGTLEPVLRAFPDDPSAHYLAGKAHLERKSFSRAQAYLERAAELGANPDILRALGATLIGSGKGKAGIGMLEQVVAARPDDLGAAFMLATLQMREGQGKRARALMASLAQRYPGNAAVINMLAAVKVSEGERESARSDFETAAQLDPAFLAPRLNLARLDRSAGRIEGARKSLQALLQSHKKAPDVFYELGLLEQSQGRYAEAASSLRAALEAEPGKVRFALALAEVQLATRQTAEALTVLKAIAIRQPGQLAVLEMLGRAQLAHGDRKAAAQAYQDMTKLSEFDPELQVRVGRLNLAAGELAAAEYNLNKARSAGSEFTPALQLEGEIALARGQLDKARAVAAALRSRPATEIAGLRLAADAALAAGDSFEAAALARQIHKRAPASANLIALAGIEARRGAGAEARRLLQGWLGEHPADARVMAMLAEQLMQGGEWAAAAVHYRQLAQLQPDSALVHNNLALVLLELGDPGALAAAQEALRLAPEAALAMDTLGWVLVRRGDLDAGLRYVRDARLRLPENPEVRWHLAYTLERLGRKADARIELAAALGSGVSFSGIEEARRLAANP